MAPIFISLMTFGQDTILKPSGTCLNLRKHPSRTRSIFVMILRKPRIQIHQYLFPVSVTPSTSVRVGGNVVGEFHDICSGGAGRNLESGRAGSCAGIARAA